MADLLLPPLSPLAKSARGWPSDPQDKPLGELAVDWNHPIAKGLVCCWMGGDVDLATGKTPVVDTNTRSIYGKDGPSASLGTTSIEANQLSFALKDEIDYVATGATVMTRFNITGAASNVYPLSFISKDTSTTEDRLGLVHSFTSPLVQGHGGGWGGTKYTGTYRNLNDQVVFVTTDPNDHYVHLDYDGGIDTVTQVPWYTAGASLDFAYYANIVWDEERTSGDIGFFCAWKRELSVAERQLLRRSPFCFLQPANQSPYLYSIPAAAGAPTLSLPTYSSVTADSATVGCTVTF